MSTSADQSHPLARPLRARPLRLLAALGIAAAATWLSLALVPQRPGTADMAAPLASAPAPAAANAPRRIYAHSVVPGGVRSREELARVIRVDQVVAAHYAGFKVEAARPLTVAKPRAMYVSYRKDGQIFWTRHKVMLEAGEMLLSDGTHDIRARCANRLSDVARFPVAQDEPAAELLNSQLEDGADAGALHGISAPQPGDDGSGPAPRLATFASGAAPARTQELSMLQLPPFAGAPGDNAALILASHAGSAVRSGAGRPAQGPTLPPDVNGAIDPATPVLLPLVTPTLALPPMAGLEAALPPGTPPATAPAPLPSPPSVTKPVELPLIGNPEEASRLPLPSTEPIAAPPFDPERPILWPPQEQPGAADRLPHGDIPEPGTAWLVGAAVAGMAWLRRRRRKELSSTCVPPRSRTPG